MEFINIGFGSMVSRERVVAVVGPDSAPIRRMTQDSGHVILSALSPEAFGAGEQEEA